MDNKTLEHHIRLIYETVNDPSLWASCLKEIATAIGAIAGKIKIIANSEETLMFQNRITSFYDSTVITKYPGDLIKLDNNLTAHDYCDFHYSMKDSIDAYIGHESDNLVKISFARCKKQEDDSVSHTIYLNRLLPHIKHALSLSSKIFEHDFESKLSQMLLDSSNSVIFIIDSDLNIIKKNTKACSFLPEQKLVKIYNERITDIYGLDKYVFSSAIKMVTDANYLEKHRNSSDKLTYFPFLIQKDTADGFWLLEISRFQCNLNEHFNNILNINTDLFAMITVRDLLNTCDSITNRLKSLYSLSDSEIEIALLLSNGLTPKEISDLRHRSIETVRTQIKQICIKVGMKNTNSLIAHINHLKD
jgi:DNA-binding CsgD family transcriptional regulator